jgi:hypothetical protein
VAQTGVNLSYPLPASLLLKGSVRATSSVIDLRPKSLITRYGRIGNYRISTTLARESSTLKCWRRLNRAALKVNENPQITLIKKDEATQQKGRRL